MSAAGEKWINKYSVGVDVGNGKDLTCVTYFRTDPNGYKWLIEQEFPKSNRFLKLRIWWMLFKFRWSQR